MPSLSKSPVSFGVRLSISKSFWNLTWLLRANRSTVSPLYWTYLSSSDTPKFAGAGVKPSDKNPPYLSPSLISGSSKRPTTLVEPSKPLFLKLVSPESLSIEAVTHLPVWLFV